MTEAGQILISRLEKFQCSVNFFAELAAAISCELDKDQERILGGGVMIEAVELCASALYLNFWHAANVV